MSKNIIPCVCNHTTEVASKFECKAFVRGNVAYALDALPQTHVEITTGTPWAQSIIHLCGTHHNLFVRGKALRLTNPINNTPIVQEDNTMTTTYTGKDYDTEYSLENALVKMDGAPYTIHSGKYGNVLIENCGHSYCIDVYNENMYEVQNDVCCGENPCNHYFVMTCTMRMPKEEEKKEEKTMTATEIEYQMDQMVLCGNCKNYHHTVDEVRDCYRGAGKITVAEEPMPELDDNYKWFPTMPKAIAFAKGKNATVKRAKNGNGVVVHLL